MSIISFDTHTFVKRLTQAGMPEAQAEVLADSQAKLIDEKLATKHDLKELEARLTHDLKELEARLTHEMKELETRLTHEMKELETRLALQLTIRMGSMLVVGIGVVATLIKIL
ncbi:MAG: hypothetical protein OXI53_07795 [Nitrospira sp.]|nr:hypothetical protein [Nitrospira sp.]